MADHPITAPSTAGPAAAVIREFAERDVAAANALTNLYIRETAVHFGYAEATDAEFAAMWGKARGKHPWLAAEVDGAFAGYAKSGVWRERDAYRFTVETTVYIDPRHHRRGVGRGLMEELLARLAAAGFHMAIAGVTLPNDASAALHEALGFERAATFPQVGWKFERWWDTGFWAKRLG